MIREEQVKNDQVMTKLYPIHAKLTEKHHPQQPGIHEQYWTLPHNHQFSIVWVEKGIEKAVWYGLVYNISLKNVKGKEFIRQLSVNKV